MVVGSEGDYVSRGRRGAGREIEEQARVLDILDFLLRFERPPRVTKNLQEFSRRAFIMGTCSTFGGGREGGRTRMRMMIHSCGSSSCCKSYHTLVEAR